MKYLSRALGFMGNQLIKIQYGRGVSIPEEFNLYEVKYFDQRFDEFWHEEAKNYEIIVIRDSKYLNWRYIENPEAYYTIFAIEENKSIKGFIVLRCIEKEIKRGHIVDILAASGREEIVNLLLLKAMGYFIKEKTQIVSCWTSEQFPVYQSLISMGFARRETPHDLIVRSFNPDMPNEYLTDKTKWYITMGDSDYF